MKKLDPASLKFSTVPNFVSLLRPIMGMVAITLWWYGYLVTGFILGIISYTTDFVDGRIARRFNCTTAFGRYLDLMGDVITTQLIFITFTVQGLIPIWVTLIVVTRESYINVFRALLNELGSSIPTSKLGKFKTFTIGSSLFFTVLKVLYPSMAMNDLSFWFLVAAAVFSLLSGIDYTIKAIKQFRMIQSEAVKVE